MQWNVTSGGGDQTFEKGLWSRRITSSLSPNPLCGLCDEHGKRWVDVCEVESTSCAKSNKWCDEVRHTGSPLKNYCRFFLFFEFFNSFSFEKNNFVTISRFLHGNALFRGVEDFFGFFFKIALAS
jgi:hypothetical protein